ncbi:MAG: hypothetical protein MZV70_68225 [Desulfobacterales bacterium]|nr:hypothetical protein [Desulfobacterales bacterium]
MARAILAKLGAREELIAEVCDIIARLQQSAGPATSRQLPGGARRRCP